MNEWVTEQRSNNNYKNNSKKNCELIYVWKTIKLPVWLTVIVDGIICVNNVGNVGAGSGFGNDE